MASYFDNKDRYITPRWRTYNSKHITPDHLLPLPSEAHSTTVRDAIGKKKEEWDEEKNFGNAWELVNAAFVADTYALAEDAARFLRYQQMDLPTNIRKMVAEILGEPEPDDKPALITTIEDITSLRDSIGVNIRKLKKKALSNARNPFHWLELGRLYSIAGKTRKAENCVKIALQLSQGQNRYIIRSSSRFYYHLGEFDKAQAIIRNVDYFKADPLLMATDITYSLKLGRTPKNMKLAIEHVESGRISPAITSELSGMLATTQYKFGDERKAKKMVKSSLQQPNDNSLAQAEWLIRQMPSADIATDLNNIDLAFEARAHENFFMSQFEKAIHEGVNWIIDQPFSKRAAHFVSYLCVSLVAKYDLAIEVCEFGLQSNPDAFVLHNNMAFAYASMDSLEKAKALLPRMQGLADSDRNRIYCLALEGYIAYKEKKYSEGKKFYEEAIELAISAGEPDLTIRAKAYLTKELFLAGEIAYGVAISILQGLKQMQVGFDLLSLINVIIEQVKKTKEVYS